MQTTTNVCKSSRRCRDPSRLWPFPTMSAQGLEPCMPITSTWDPGQLHSPIARAIAARSNPFSSAAPSTRDIGQAGQYLKVPVHALYSFRPSSQLLLASWISRFLSGSRYPAATHKHGSRSVLRFAFLHMQLRSPLELCLALYSQ